MAVLSRQGSLFPYSARYAMTATVKLRPGKSDKKSGCRTRRRAPLRSLQIRREEWHPVKNHRTSRKNRGNRPLTALRIIHTCLYKLNIVIKLCGKRRRQRKENGIRRRAHGISSSGKLRELNWKSLSYHKPQTAPKFMIP